MDIYCEKQSEETTIQITSSKEKCKKTCAYKTIVYLLFVFVFSLFALPTYLPYSVLQMDSRLKPQVTKVYRFKKVSKQMQTFQKKIKSMQTFQKE